MDQRKALEEELGEFMDKGWIRPSTSEWATIPLIVPKKNGKPRVCIDYRDLNAIAELDAYPLPKIDELLNKLAGAQWFTKIDLKSEFHQIPMHSESIPLTAFRVGAPIKDCSHFEWVVMPMGLSTAPATFQRWMDESLKGLEAKVLVYLDNVLVFSESKQQHQKDVEKVLQRFRDRKMRVKRTKCVFQRREMPFLGHVVSQGKIKVDPDKMTRLDEWNAPLKNAKEVRRCMGFFSYYRAFVRNVAEVTAPLTDLLCKTTKWQWTEQATEAL